MRFVQPVHLCERDPHSGRVVVVNASKREAEAYLGACVVRCRDAEFKPGACCPQDGRRDKLYDTKQPPIFIRLTGQPLVGAIRYEQEVLRRSAFTCATAKPAGSAKRLYYANASNASLLLKHDLDDFDCLIVAPFLLTPPCQMRKISATSLKSNPRKL